MNIPLVDLKTQYKSIEQEIMLAVEEVFTSCGFIGGPHIKQCEDDFAAMCGAACGVATSSGTTALHVALDSLGITDGDEVITVSNTFAATVEAIIQTGATVKFCDIDRDTYNIDVTRIEGLITGQTKAIVPVHLYGQPCDMDAILALADKHNLWVINDTAQAHLAQYKGKPLGSYGHCGCYSFYPGKNLGCYGDGGMVITNDAQLATKMRMLTNHGTSSKYVHEMPGYNYRLDAVQAAILNVKLRHIVNWTKLRQKAAALYTEKLKDVDVVTPFIQDDIAHVFHLYVVRVENRDEVFKHMQDQGIGVGLHYPVPLHLQKAFASLGYGEGSLPVTEEVAGKILSLPMFPEITEEQIDYICENLKDNV